VVIVGYREPDVNIDQLDCCGEAVEFGVMWWSSQKTGFLKDVGVLRLRLPFASLTAMLAQDDRVVSYHQFYPGFFGDCW
jgi:hypothetical protein